MGALPGSLDSIQMLAAIVGFIFAQIAVVAMTRWIGLVYFAITEARGADGRIEVRRGITLAVCESLFHAGPWSAVVALFVAYHMRAESWATWLFGGFAVGFVVIAGATLRIALKFRKRRHEEPNAV